MTIAVDLQSWVGRATARFDVASAALTIPSGMATGKFQGETTTATPRAV